jgi:Cytochrome c554 and c-prime
MMFRRSFALFSLFFILTAVYSAAASNSVSSTPSQASPLNPHGVLGSDSCVKCHASEINVWKLTPHWRTFDELHRRPEAKQIADKLGLQSIKHDGRCVSCHYTPQAQPAGDVHVIAGVSCESCHGAAKTWLDRHHDYGGDSITRLTESSEHRRARIADSVAAGMRNPANVYLVAQSCLRCHTTADEQLVNLGGHSVGSLEFEFVSWSQGTIRHNFVRSDGKSNDVSSPERLRVMFVAGILAEVEAGLRATAVATEKATYGITAAQRTARAAKKLQSIGAKVDSQHVAQALDVFSKVALKLNNGPELTQAADQIARIGIEMGEVETGAGFAALDQFIPQPNQYK